MDEAIRAAGRRPPDLDLRLVDAPAAWENAAMAAGKLRWAYAAATAVHLAVVGWFALGKPPSSPGSVLPPAASAVEIELAAPVEEVAASTAAAPSTVVAASSETRHARSLTPAPALAAEAVPAENGGVERATDWVVHPTGSIDLSLPRSAFARDSDGPPEHAPIPTVGGSKSGGLVESLDARDVAMGLGRGGPIQAAVDAAAHDPAAPVLGSAVFA